MISVIIHIHNNEEFLYVSINSVLRQTYQNFEVICVDDASNDSSLNILNYFSKKDSRVKIIKNDSNKGVGFSLNSGLEMAEGDYVFFLDGNDWISQDAFQVLIKKIKNENLDLILFKNVVFYDNLHEFGIEEYYNNSSLNSFENKVFNHYDLDKTALFSIPHVLWNKLYRKSFLDEHNIRFPNEKLIPNEISFFFKVFTSAKRISFENSYLYTHRKIFNSLILDKKRVFDDVQMVYPIISVFLENKELFDYYKKEVLTYIFYDVLYKKYYKLEKNLKEELFNEIQIVFRSFIKDYGLYKYIKENVSEDILIKFKFEDIVDELTRYIPKISVIVPVYNVEKYLHKCLDSIINQRFRDIEIICINDGSTDSSLDILEIYAKKDNRIKVISQKNSGPGHARNVGLANANGEYISFVDSDDFLCENSLMEVYFNAISNDSDISIFKFYNFNEDGDTYIPTGLLSDDVFGEVDYNNFTFTYKDIKEHVMHNYFAVWFKLYKKEFLDRYALSFPEGIVYEDVLFQVKSFLFADKMSFLPKHLYNYTVSNTDSIMNNGSQIFDIVGVIDSVEEFLRDFLVYDEFELEFSMFKIIHLAHHIFNSKSNDYFDFVKKEFINLRDDFNLDFENMAPKAKIMFNNVLNSNSLDDYIKKL